MLRGTPFLPSARIFRARRPEVDGYHWYHVKNTNADDARHAAILVLRLYPGASQPVMAMPPIEETAAVTNGKYAC